MHCLQAGNDDTCRDKPCVVTVLGNISTRPTVNYTMELLHNHLEHYDGRLRPVHNQRDLVIVNMVFTLDMLRDFNDVSGEITFLGTSSMKWKEERLQWNKANYGEIGKMILPKEDVWNLELFMASSLNILSHLVGPHLRSPSPPKERQE